MHGNLQSIQIKLNGSGAQFIIIVRKELHRKLSYNNIVDRDVDQLDEVTDEAHDKEANG